MEATITKNGLVYSVDMKTIYYADDSGEFKGTIPNGVERIEDEAFSCCAVEKIYIPDSVTSVGSNLFENATSLKSVRLPSRLKKLSPYMFAGCSSLEQIEMPFEIESFEEGLFAGCSSLKEIPFRAGLKELPKYVFSGCSQLCSLILPNTIEKIFEGAVSDCENLTTLVLPASLKEIEEGAFEGCFNLCHIRLNGENGYFRVDDAESSLYKKNPDGTETLILHLERNTLSKVPTFHEVDEAAPVSILDFNEEDDIADDDSDIILTQEELDKVCQRGEDSSEDVMQKFETAIPNPIEDFATEESNADVADRLAEIMGQSSVSTSDEISADEIPYATAEELEAGRLTPSAQAVEETENAEYEDVFFEMDEGEYSSCIEDYFFGIGRYETIAMETSCDEEKTLYVFAKLLNAEHNFSSKLISCCRRLANVHNYSQVKLLSNPQFIEENREKFSDFMKEKDVIYACSVDSLSLITEDEKDLCGLLGIALDRDGLIEQSKTASDKNAPFIKLLIQDILD